MNKIIYASRLVFKPKATNFIKLISLTIGLALGAMMFTAIAYNYTFDTFYEDSDRICIIYADYVNGEQHSRDKFAFAPAPLAPVAETELKGVECATRFYGPNLKNIRKANSDILSSLNIAKADKNYFKVFNLILTAGNASDFALPGSIFLSEKKAHEIFTSTDIIGNSIVEESGYVYTVRGVFKDLPYNTSWDINAIAYAKDEEFPDHWLENHWCNTFLKLTRGTSIKEIEKQLPDLQERHYDVKGNRAKGKYVTLSATMLKWHHNQQGSAGSANIIVFVMGLVILIISGLNYVLLTIASINSRAKEIGVHKCNGASKKSLFALILYETLIYIIVSLLLAYVALVAFRGSFETVTSAPLSDIFCLENLYAVGITIVLLFLVSAVIPAQVFSSIPVTLVFRQQSTKRTPWKKALLFFQLFATIFILCFLVIVIRQNKSLFSASHGIKMEPLVVTEIKSTTLERALTICSELKNRENVIQGTISSSIPLNYPTTDNVMESGSDVTLFPSSIIESDNNFLSTYQIPLLYGDFLRDATDSASVVINERFALLFGWEPSDAVGKHFLFKGKMLYVSGVVKDFHLSHLKILEQFPLIMCGFGLFEESQEEESTVRNFKLTLSLNDTGADAISAANNEISRLISNNPPKFKPYKDELFEYYQGEVTQRKIVTVAAVVILILSFIGVISYVSAEVGRRKQEIAIRRINGATIEDVLRMISQGILYYAIAAALMGSLFSLYIANIWQQNFYIKTTLSPWIFIIVSLTILITVTITTIIQSIKIVSTNPAKILHSSTQ